MSEVCVEQSAAAFLSTIKTAPGRHRTQNVQMDEITLVRQALEGTALAPCAMATLDILRDPSRSRTCSMNQCPTLMPMQARSSWMKRSSLATFGRLGREQREGGMTIELLGTILGSPPHTHHLLFRARELLARNTIVDIIRVGSFTALSKPDGGLRGIAAGDVIRLWVAKTMARQLGSAVGAVTGPQQCAFWTRSECVAHSFHMTCEADPEFTICDWVGAFGLISKWATWQCGGWPSCAFFRPRFTRPSTFLWEDAESTVHAINQSAGGDKGMR